MMLLSECLPLQAVVISIISLEGQGEIILLAASLQVLSAKSRHYFQHHVSSDRPAHHRGVMSYWGTL